MQLELRRPKAVRIHPSSKQLFVAKPASEARVVRSGKTTLHLAVVGPSTPAISAG